MNAILWIFVKDNSNSSFHRSGVKYRVDCIVKQVVRKSLRMIVPKQKKCLLYGYIILYTWLSTEYMWMDVLTKEMKLLEGLEMCR